MTDDSFNILPIVQYNVNRQQACMDDLFRKLRPDRHLIIAIQEPFSYARIRGTKRYPNYHLLIPDGHFRTCFYVSKQLPVNRWKFKSTSGDCCSIILDTQSPISVHNVYNPVQPTPRSMVEGTLALLPQLLSEPGEHVVVGDFNLHHPRWGGQGCVSQDAAADIFIRLTDRFNLEYTLEPGTITREVANSATTIDLVLASPSLSARLVHCYHESRLDCGSDHNPIFTAFQTQPITRATVRRRNWKDVNWERFRTMLSARLAALPRADLGTTDGLDQHAVDIQRALTDTVDELVPYKTVVDKSRPAWSRDCSELVRRSRQALWTWRRTRTPEDWELYRSLDNAKKRAIRRENTKNWRKEVAKATSDPSAVWRLVKWAKDRADRPPEPPQIPPLRASPDDTVYRSGVVTSQDKFGKTKLSLGLAALILVPSWARRDQASSQVLDKPRSYYIIM